MAASATTSCSVIQPKFSANETFPFSTLGAMSELKDRITYLRLGLGLTQEQFRDALNAELRASGQQPVSRGAVSNWESGSKGAAMRNLIALSGLTGASIDWLANARGAGPTERDLQAIGSRLRAHNLPVLAIDGGVKYPESVPVFGQAAGATLSNGAAILFDEQPIGMLPMLPGLAGLRDVYGLEVTGESMLPMFKPGDPVYVSPHSPIRKDDAMIVIEHRSRNGESLAFIKLLVAERSAEVVGRQLNPEATIRYQRKPGLTIQRVLTLREAIGYSGGNTVPQETLQRAPRGPRRKASITG